MKGSIFIAGLIIAWSCVDNYRIPELQHNYRLVVDGLITTEPGPHTVTLTLTQPPSNTYENRQFVSGAQLRVVTNDDTIVLAERAPGRYATPSGWQAETGKSYTLFIALANGRTYRSETQEIYPAGNIDALNTIFEFNSINSVDPFLPQHSFGVYIDARAVPGTPGLLRWRWKGVFKILSDPANKTKFDPDCMCQVPDPPPCAMECSCCECWITDFSASAVVSNNQFVSENIFRNRLVGRITVDSWRFAYKYYVEVEQLSLSPAVYSFWKRVEAQQQSVSNIFQPNVIRIRGNISRVDDSSEDVYGIVAFSDVIRKSRFIEKTEVPFILPSPPLITEDCRLIFRNKPSTNEKPPFW
jgi:hypothetical protein